MPTPGERYIMADMLNRILFLLLDDPRRPAFLLGLGSVAVLLVALTFQFGFGFLPCQLCIWQRWPYVIVAALAAVAVPFGQMRWMLALLLGAMAMALLFNSGLALYHTGVEQHWWINSFDCGAPATTSTSLADLREQLMATPYVPCDKIPWALFGISMAGYNIVASAAMSAFAAVTGWLILKHDNHA